MTITRDFIYSKEGNVNYILNTNEKMISYCKLYDKYEITLNVSNIKDGEYYFILNQDDKELYSSNVKAVRGVIDIVVKSNKAIKYSEKICSRFKILDGDIVVIDAIRESI